MDLLQPNIVEVVRELLWGNSAFSYVEPVENRGDHVCKGNSLPQTHFVSIPEYPAVQSDPGTQRRWASIKIGNSKQRQISRTSHRETGECDSEFNSTRRSFCVFQPCTSVRRLLMADTAAQDNVEAMTVTNVVGWPMPGFHDELGADRPQAWQISIEDRPEL